jgi:nicotinate-nucleotide pyrophosphorylase (carboxylating)
MHNLTELIRTALAEDLGEHGDITTQATVDAEAVGKARIVAKAPGIIAGEFVVEQVFKTVDPKLKIDVLVEDGSPVTAGLNVILVHGPQRGILMGERTALNFLCHLSGIATLTARFVTAVAGTNAKILDTRKTNPGMRTLEKYAVKMADGHNHRAGLYDMMLIKENHIAAAGSITTAVRRCRDYLVEQQLARKIEVETQTLKEVEEAVALHVDRIMLDNMSLETIQHAVNLVAGRVKIEASGGVTIENVRSIAETGVDFISIGQLTHSAPALDFSLLME